MKCPHCNQEHPKGYQFCPKTGKELLKACTLNLKCPDHGKYILPLDSRFCPTCGYILEGVSANSTIDWNKLFPIFGVTLGETNIYDMTTSKRIKEVACGLRYEVHGRDVAVFQRKGDDFISGMYVLESNNTTFPKKWRSLLGLGFGMSIRECRAALENKKIEIKDIKRGSGYCAFITPDKQFVIKLSFRGGRFTQLDVTLYKCPYCGSDDVEILYDEDDEIELLCQSCGREWGAANDYGDSDSDMENDDNLRCPECGSDDVSDDESGCYQYECNHCGHVWGDEKEEDDVSESLTGNHYRITNRCVACGICLDECPVGAISEGRIYAIDKSTCVGCGTCAAICPNEAIQYC